ncbi:MAG: substrate-binding domain-containing protein [Planctomycetes bacterium]|nr:substrate-binding domain-containing protein [Planctomycetota bacterium]
MKPWKVAFGLGLALASASVPAQQRGDRAEREPADVVVPAGLTGKVVVRGSDVLLKPAEEVERAFEARAKAVAVDIVGGGSGAGLDRLAAGACDIAMTSRPIRKHERDRLRKQGVAFVEVPVALDALAFVVSRDCDWVDYLTVAEVRKLFGADGGIRTWRDLRESWPDREIQVHAQSNGFRVARLRRELPRNTRLRKDLTGWTSEREVARAVATTASSLGMLSCPEAWRDADDLRLVRIKDGAGPVAPSRAEVGHGKYWAFCEPTLLYVSAKALERPEVAAFVTFYIEWMPRIGQDHGFSPISGPLKMAALRKLRAREVGTHFLDESGEPKQGSLAKLYR